MKINDLDHDTLIEMKLADAEARRRDAQAIVDSIDEEIRQLRVDWYLNSERTALLPRFHALSGPGAVTGSDIGQLHRDFVDLHDWAIANKSPLLADIAPVRAAYDAYVDADWAAMMTELAVLPKANTSIDGLADDDIPW